MIENASKFFRSYVSTSTQYKIDKFLYRYRFKKLFKNKHGYPLNVDSPQTWNEKIIYRKLNGNLDNMSLFADKILVRDYVESKIGNKYLIPLIDVKNKLSASDISSYPNSFVAKTNHGSGEEHIVIVKDKEQVDKVEIVNKLNHAVNTEFGGITGEKFYELIDRKILVEKFLGENDKTPDDFKFHCFNNNNGTTIFIQVDTGRYNSHRRSIFSVDWEKLDFKLEPKYPYIEDMVKPKELNEMISVAKALSEDFDYVRVDLYCVAGNIYFGEITQTHGNGMERFEPSEIDKKWGGLWEINKENKGLYR